MECNWKQHFVLFFYFSILWKGLKEWTFNGKQLLICYLLLELMYGSQPLCRALVTCKAGICIPLLYILVLLSTTLSWRLQVRWGGDVWSWCLLFFPQCCLSIHPLPSLTATAFQDVPWVSRGSESNILMIPEHWSLLSISECYNTLHIGTVHKKKKKETG